MPKKNNKKPTEEMTHSEIKVELTEIITRDVIRFCETVIRQRVSLFVEEIYEGVRAKSDPQSGERGE